MYVLFIGLYKIEYEHIYFYYWLIRLDFVAFKQGISINNNPCSLIIQRCKKIITYNQKLNYIFRKISLVT